MSRGDAGDACAADSAEQGVASASRQLAPKAATLAVSDMKAYSFQKGYALFRRSP